MTIKDMPHVTVEQVLALRDAAIELEQERNELAARVEHVKVAGRMLKFAIERGYNPANEENELEYIMRRFDELAAQLERLNIEVLEEIENRDDREKVADLLADEIAMFFDIDIGEHSSENSPWQNAFEAIQNTTLAALKTKWQAEAVDHCEKEVTDSFNVLLKPHIAGVFAVIRHRAQEAGNE